MSYNRKIKAKILSFADKMAVSFDWFEALNYKCKNPADDELDEELFRRADRWESCACGNMCAVIPRRADGEPVDYELKKLGFDFTKHVETAVELASKDDWAKALKVFVEIENRSFQLLYEMGVITLKGVYTQKWINQHPHLLKTDEE